MTLRARMLFSIACTSILCSACGSEESHGTTAGTTGDPPMGKYSFELFDVPGAKSQSVPLGITDSGTVSGYFDDVAGKFHGFIWRDGKFTTIDAPGAVDTFVVSAFDDGRYNGDFRDANGVVHAFTFANDVYTTLDAPEAGETKNIPFEVGTGLGTAGFAMNSKGVIVGEYATDDGVGHGFLLDGGVYTTVDHPDALGAQGPNTTLFAAAADGRVVGRITTAGSSRYKSFVLQDGKFTDVVHPDAGGMFGTQANGITDAGIITGVYSDAGTNLHGFLLKDGEFTTIDYPKAPHSEVHAMDSAGNLVGGWYDSNLNLHGFLARLE